MSVPDPARPVRVLDYGERALLVEVGSERVADYAAAIAALSRPEVVDIVPAAATVLVRVDDPQRLGAIRALVGGMEPAAAPQSSEPPLVVPVLYDGPDLVEVADRCGLTTDEVIDRHQASDHRVQFCGFSPGFGYIAGLDPALDLPRRASPRPRVPAGSVSIAGRYSAIYPTSTPGGWHLIGHTDLVLFDPELFDEGVSPALLVPGRSIRFEAVT